MKVTLCCILFSITLLVNGLGSSEYKDNSNPTEESSWSPHQSSVVVLVKINGNFQRKNRPDHLNAPQLVFLVGHRSNLTTTDDHTQSTVESPDPRHGKDDESNDHLENNEDLTSDSIPPRIDEERQSNVGESVEENSRTNLFDIVVRPRRKLSIQNVPPPPTSLSPPPVDHDTSYSQLTHIPQQFTRQLESDIEEENHYDDSDTVSPFIVLPNLFQDWSQLLKQPLRITKIKDSMKEPSKDHPYNEQWTNRDSEDYGMVAKAPYILCPLGSRLDSLGNCRPLFRNRREYSSRRSKKQKNQQLHNHLKPPPVSLTTVV